MSVRRFLSTSLCLTALGSLGCAADLIPPPVLSDASLGRIIIYRNGVAYFERYAHIDEDELTIRVPEERVDDFLKSLTILDEDTGETMPVSFPTVEPDGGEVTMTIKLPKGKRRLRISYVTESPAWKPTYRVVLAEDGPATLQAWAVVDNISGEDWQQVKVGVGSTSALSFRYDLHSVRLVERETLSADPAMAHAPPTGGSPYAVATRKVRVFGNLSKEELASLDGRGDVDEELADDAMPEPEEASATVSLGGAGRAESWRGRASKKPPSQVGNRRQSARFAESLSNKLRSSGERIRIEGFAQSGDDNPQRASLARANALRDRLISEGVPEAQIDVLGTGKMNAREAVRVVAVDPTEHAAQQAKAAGIDEQASDQPLGSAHFVSSVPMTIERDHSAMVSILNAKTDAKRVFFYDPISARGSKDFAFNAVRITNPSEYTLDSGPFTVYAGGQFLGEGLSEPILPKSVAFIPYALDRSILAEPEIATREEIDRLLTIQRGIVTTETQRIRKTTLTLTNRGQQPAEVFVRHKLQPGYELKKSTKAKLKIEKLGGAHLFPVRLPPGQAVKVVIEEQTPIMKTVDIRTPRGIGAIDLYLKKAKIEPELKAKLDDIVKTYTAIAELEERIAVLNQQMAVYRTRVDEINVQLVTLRKVPQAGKLRRHLSTKMEEISDKLQEATMQMTDLKEQLMTRRIALQDKLADLTLKRPKKKDENGSSAAGAAKGQGS
ncbi:MAG: DUF4139 domain-containing protein [Deltaproteobacteria bacterium]|nr:DUF4139 domain-containing protein [Deltaproteobacteria bacterium]MBW2532938.1 DUF4139 domain-containing protein [Deltaproteobacteria bacterium]